MKVAATSASDRQGHQAAMAKGMRGVDNAMAGYGLLQNLVTRP